MAPALASYHRDAGPVLAVPNRDRAGLRANGSRLAPVLPVWRRQRRYVSYVEGCATSVRTSHYLLTESNSGRRTGATESRRASTSWGIETETDGG